MCVHHAALVLNSPPLSLTSWKSNGRVLGGRRLLYASEKEQSVPAEGSPTTLLQNILLHIIIKKKKKQKKKKKKQATSLFLAFFFSLSLNLCREMGVNYCTLSSDIWAGDQGAGHELVVKHRLIIMLLISVRHTLPLNSLPFILRNTKLECLVEKGK
ncbi:hypothetical protein QTO34_005441 [Cnephaeus nilssonii]|uniref:Uncharacterized protein n=1 Tax=Cnephaeus nilssonii TaxID=3371016 RepID=A0AA40HNF9_CNENI|nr:hypothetical protein QTO34_005441 [Eptesicus nilssonii]